MGLRWERAKGRPLGLITKSTAPPPELNRLFTVDPTDSYDVLDRRRPQPTPAQTLAYELLLGACEDLKKPHGPKGCLPCRAWAWLTGAPAPLSVGYVADALGVNLEAVLPRLRYPGRHPYRRGSWARLAAPPRSGI